MTDPDLKKQLAQLATPVPDETAKGRALHRALIARDHPEARISAAERLGARWRTSYGWLAGTAVLAIVVFVATVRFRPDAVTVAPVVAGAAGSSAGADLRMLTQVEGLFPGQLNAVIERDGAVKLDLSDVADTQADADEQPLVVQLERGDQRLRVLSYSGRSVTVELKGRRVTFEALVTSDGGVVLSGDDFAWSSAQPALLAGYQVQARSLTAL